MKKALVATILGLATVASTFAQGKIIFGNYGAGGLNAPITYGSLSGALNGQLVPGPTFTATLYYQLGTVSLAAASGAATPVPGGWNLVTGSSTAIDSNDPGYFYGPQLFINDYVSGSISFVVVASGTVASTPYSGRSAAFTLNSIATGLSPAGNFGSAMSSFVVNPVPEPSTFALAGLGLASLLIFRRRK